MAATLISELSLIAVTKIVRNAVSTMIDALIVTTTPTAAMPRTNDFPGGHMN
jgi:hypothetical protein